MMEAFVLFVVFLAGLVWGSGRFVESAARIAKMIGVSELVIGLSVVAWGTSLPELITAAIASAEGVGGLAVGNIIGSNIANIGMVLAISAVVGMLVTNRRMFMRDCMMLVGVTFLFYIMAIDGTIGTAEAFFLLALMVGYLFYLFEFVPKFRHLYRFKEFYRAFFKLQWLVNPRRYGEVFEGVFAKPEKVLVDAEGRAVKPENEAVRRGLIKEVVFLFTSGAVLLFSASQLIPLAQKIAAGFGVTEGIIGLTLIAIGTSLPELAVSMSAVRKGFSNLLVGNIIGSNMVNLIWVGGLSAFINPLPIGEIALDLSLPFLLLMTLLLFVFVRSGWRVKKIEGAALFILYAAFMWKLVTHPLF